MPSSSFSRDKVIWMSTGGTGGHLFPALACADELLQHAPHLKIYLIGGGMKGVLAHTVQSSRSIFPYIKVPCGDLSFKGLLGIGRGVYHSCKAIHAERPDAIVGFGSYFSLPPLIAARFMRVPLFLHAADSMPGKVIRHFSAYARCSFLQFEEAAESLKGETFCVKRAIRPHMRKGRYSREEAAKLMGVRADLPILLIFGGSQGAKRLNEVIMAAVERGLPPMQILHYTGDENLVNPLQQLYAKHGHHSLVKAYEERMDLAWTLADSAITRCGASTVAELIEYEVPSLVIPYPHAADDHQEKNARSLLKAEAGIERVIEKELTTEALMQAIHRLVHLPAYNKEMREKLARYKKTQPQESMASLLLQQIYF